MQKTTMLKKEVVATTRKWYEIDATGVVLGRLSVEVANLLRGKNKPNFTPNVDCGDYVIVRNAKNVILTGNKVQKEKWYTHSQYIGGLRTRTGKEMIEKYSPELITTAVKGMLPKNRLAKQILAKLTVYADQGIAHEAQKPIKINLKGTK